MGLKPLKKFGQNYLIDKNIVNKMIQPLELNQNSSVLEIGPGKGFLTKELFKIVKNLTAVEIDSRVGEELKQTFPNLNLIQKDFLKIKLADLNLCFPIKIIGNIPFNITGRILFQLIEEKDVISDAVLMMPLDIAKRIVAKKSTKEYGILTVVFSYFSTAKIVTKVSPNVFFPKPNIDSAIIHIKFDKKEKDNIDKELFINVVKAAFGNRRKTLNNSLRNSIFNNCDFSGFDNYLLKRAEELEVEDFLIICEYLQKQECKKIIK